MEAASHLRSKREQLALGQPVLNLCDVLGPPFKPVAAIPVAVLGDQAQFERLAIEAVTSVVSYMNLHKAEIITGSSPAARHSL